MLGQSGGQTHCSLAIRAEVVGPRQICASESVRAEAFELTASAEVGALATPVCMLCFLVLVTAIGSTLLRSASVHTAGRTALALTPVTLNAVRE